MQSSSVQSFFPLVSVIIPAYNAETYLTRTLQSVLTQNYQNLEVIVIDDGSEDNTCHIVELIAKTDPRVILLRQGNAGVASARNHGIQRAKGEFVAPIDSDDLWYPENIEQQVQYFLMSGERVGLVYSWSVDIDETGALLGSFRAAKIQGNVYATLVCHNFLGNASASMIRRSCLEQVGGYNSKLRSQQAQGCEDWDLYLRIAEKFEYRVVPKFLVGYRKLSASMSCDYQQMRRSHDLVMQAVHSRHPEIPAYLFRLSRSNLYFYFAHQSYRIRRYDKTGFWLKQAIRADLLSCWIRPGLYIRGVQLLWHLLCKGSSTHSAEASTPIPRSLTRQDIEQKTGTIAAMLGVGLLFHRIISAIARHSLASRLRLSSNSEGGTP